MQQSPSSASRRRRGFTLVELLVVIGILIVLAGLLLPMLLRAYRNATKIRAASDLNAIATALEAYKQQCFDYPRIIYSSSTPFNGTGSGAALLGKALLGLGDAGTLNTTTNTYVSYTYLSTQTYSPGSIVNPTGSGSIDYGAIANVPVSTPPPNATYWAPIPLSTATDGYDGPGFRVRTMGQVYGPYLQPGKFKTVGLAIADSWGNPILYYAANPGHPSITVDGNSGSFGSISGNGGLSNSYVGSAPGVTPGAGVFTPATPCSSLYNYSDNDTAALNASVGAGTFPNTFPDISVMEAMLGDYGHQGYISPGETAATTGAFLLWSAGPDGVYGPIQASQNISNFKAGTTSQVKNWVNQCDDVTNFSTGQ
jgi:prepilin-type N-terminal cleavage/methylation domain-containing protein